MSTAGWPWHAPGFLKLQCWYACLCVHPKALDENKLVKQVLLLYMTLTIDIIGGCVLSNKMCHEFLPKKRKVMLY